MKLRVRKLSSLNGFVVAGRYQWFRTGGITDDVVKVMNAFYLTNWPDKMTIDSICTCDLRQSNKGGVKFNISFNGSKSEYDRTIEKLLQSTRCLYETLASQWLEEMERAYPQNKTYELYSSFVFGNDDKGTIENVTDTIPRLMLMASFHKEFDGEQVNFLVTWIHSGGKSNEEETDRFRLLLAESSVPRLCYDRVGSQVDGGGYKAFLGQGEEGASAAVV
ncbi:uncharacterized protein QC763_204770 [Podospora pseudopauciseta]|uniref:Uncharacterized protein n=1 Tax=Podospora pseudopauciseta TaxID=2093780 RepID=A0ABR0HP73_9PEZI|nr:hypothetical protein QC763_204770 [Podospora pseudopauciseta]